MQPERLPKTPWHTLITSCFQTACQGAIIEVHPEEPITAELPLMDMVLCTGKRSFIPIRDVAQTKGEITMSTISLEWFQKELSQIPADVVAAVLEDNPTMRQYSEQVKNQGIQQGFTKGAHASLIRAINNIISIRFGGTMEMFDAQLQKLDTQTLEELHKIAVQVASLAEFAASVEQASVR